MARGEGDSGIVWGAVVAQTVFVAAAFAVALGWLGDGDPFDGSPRDFALVFGIHAANVVLVLGGVLVGLGGRSPTGLGWGEDPAPARSVALGVTGAVICASIVAGVGLVLGGVDGLRETVSGFVHMPVQQRLLCALIGLGAALCEETVFRGTLQPWLVARLGPVAGIAVGALVFSAYHLRFAPVGFAVKALFGLLFGALRYHTGRNWASALAHAGVWLLVGFA